MSTTSLAQEKHCSQTLHSNVTTHKCLRIISDGHQTSIMVRAPADVSDALGVTSELSETAGDHHTLSFTLARGWGSQIANCHHSIPSVLQTYWTDYLPISWCLHCVLVFVKLLVTFSISVCYVCSALWLSHRVSALQISIIIIITIIKISIIIIIIIIMCVMFVHHFEPWGKRFTNFHYY